jgi:hypothetical protein
VETLFHTVCAFIIIGPVFHVEGVNVVMTVGIGIFRSIAFFIVGMLNEVTLAVKDVICG